MALTLQGRLATVDDADILIRGAAEAGNPTWTHDTVTSYLSDPNARIFVVLARWPEQGMATFRPVAMIHAMVRGTRLWVMHLAVDRSAIPDTFQAQQRRIADRLLVFLLNAAINAGLVDGMARRIPNGSRIANYIDTITGVTKTPASGGWANESDYSMDLVAARNFLQARSPS